MGRPRPLRTGDVLLNTSSTTATTRQFVPVSSPSNQPSNGLVLGGQAEIHEQLNSYNDRIDVTTTVDPLDDTEIYFYDPHV